MLQAPPGKPPAPVAAYIKAAEVVTAAGAHSSFSREKI